MWLAVDRNRNQILDFEVTKTLDIWAYQTIADRLRKRYNINILCTDGDYAYDKLKIAKRHIITKSETCLVESKNTIIRRRLARFNRRTCRYSKAFDMVVASLTLLFRENILLSIFIWERLILHFLLFPFFASFFRHASTGFTAGGQGIS